MKYFLTNLFVAISAVVLVFVAVGGIVTCASPTVAPPAELATAKPAALLLNSSNYLNIPAKLKTKNAGPFVLTLTNDGSGDEATVRGLPHRAAAMGAQYLILDIETPNAIQAAAYPNDPTQAIVATMFQAVGWVRAENVPGVKLGIFGTATYIGNTLAVVEQADVDFAVPFIELSEYDGSTGANMTWEDLMGVEIAACRAVRPNLPIVPMMSPRVEYNSPTWGPACTMFPPAIIQRQINYLYKQCKGFAVWDPSTPPADAAQGLFTQTDWATASWWPLVEAL